MSSISFFKVPKDGNVEEIKKRVSAIIGDGDDDGIPIPMAVDETLQKLKQESPNHKSYKQFREYAAYLRLVKSGKVGCDCGYIYERNDVKYNRDSIEDNEYGLRVPHFDKKLWVYALCPKCNYQKAWWKTLANDGSERDSRWFFTSHHKS